MRVPIYTTIANSNNNKITTSSAATTTPTISPTSNLRIEMTMQTKSRRHTKKYRALERSDGVIIEYPRYQPASSAPRPALHFEKKLFTLDNTRISSKPKEKSRAIGAMDEDMVDIGAHFVACGRDGYNAPVVCGRGGYNGPFDLQTGSQKQRHCGLMPMQRFLAEAGPWTTFEVRES
ncbi:Nn.00g107550.m01.CDS01 [Neocucurbitaria sp. VM-36]